MENSSNLTILINLLINGMIIVFAVLFLVFVIGKMIIKTFSSYEIQNSSSPDVEKLLDKKIKNLSGGKGKIIKYTKIN
ncbi:MAG: hypothetical protein CMF54_00065 [Legionellales bacterium]|nr:hypothetical protein [Legionellales bacterium]|tara:strand:+ start:3209 stop:3442 length:234 start_codon:yes stop_codon:yes gene_type:complete